MGEKMKKLANLYLDDKMVWRNREHIAIEDENGYLFSQGRYKTKIRPDDLPEWYVRGYFYKRWGYMSAKGVKYLHYRPNMTFNHMFKDDFLFISYDKPIVPAESDPLWYQGYDEYVFGGAILSMVRAIDRYSDCDTTEVKKAIEVKRQWFKETYPRWYGVEVREDKPFFEV